MIISEYSPILRLCEYSPIITSPSAINCLIYIYIYDSDLVNACDSEFVDAYTNDLVNFFSHARMWKDDHL